MIKNRKYYLHGRLFLAGQVLETLGYKGRSNTLSTYNLVYDSY